MRETKFRGLRTDGKGWVTGCLVKYWTSESDSYVGIMGWKGDHFEVVLESIGQFTGLTDKTGREIYEGDIMQHANPFDIPFVVNWDEEQCAFVFNSGSTSYYIGDSSFTVIGNIYENPELLK
jgi:uncharacterized phage protein (TIGR01671 family)